MTIFLIIIAFFAGAVYGYAKSVEHCQHEQDKKDTPRFRGPY